MLRLHGEGAHFCAGLDLKELGTSGLSADPDATPLPFGSLHKPLIGAVNGAAVTGRAPAWGLHLDDARRGEVLLRLSGFSETAGASDTLFTAVEALSVAGQHKEAAALYPLVLDAIEHRGEWVTFDGRLTQTRAAIAAAASPTVIGLE